MLLLGDFAISRTYLVVFGWVFAMYMKTFRFLKLFGLNVLALISAALCTCLKCSLYHVVVACSCSVAENRDDDVANFAMLVPGALATLCLMTARAVRLLNQTGGRKRPPRVFVHTAVSQATNMIN